MIILAAGQGKRLRPLTNNYPKCMVEVDGKPLIEWQIEVARQCGLNDLSIVCGYKSEMIKISDVTYFHNPYYEKTNMVETLWCSKSVFGNEFIVSYGDIIYEERVLNALLDDNHPVSVVVDTGWQEQWSERFENVLDDAETLKVTDEGKITNIGQVPSSINEIQGQYIGLVAFRNEGVLALNDIYNKAKIQSKDGSKPLRGQRSFENLYMTDILQGLIDDEYPIHAVKINRGWLEIDSMRDLEIANYKVRSTKGKIQILS